ncbi:MAG: type II toxin-antitoxin system VapC family toxin [Deltaproteobacteria bacterium]|nr:type II toxin-antitoxin system VapC family toxin [Deltaproteobacteria bacterium]MBW2356507.1 type II toxin-antitoxin system VapC family toxin [Deltaproteobacteria bacterium]RLB93178.1 MAG: hypothetical protein DRH76_10470 [Deltaproteobacteria bacterium]
MILVDANILMYAAGAEHPFKQPSVAFLGKVAEGAVSAVIDAEALQEILHRYLSIGRWGEGRQVYDLARQIFPEVLPITAEILDRTRELLDSAVPGIMARDALHAAVCELNGCQAICSYDSDFDRISSIRRIEPAADSSPPFKA